MAKKPFQPTSDQAETALERGVLYEMQRFAALLSNWQGWNHARDNYTKCACLESLLLHVRILKDFFERADRQGSHDDVLCTDFGFPAKPVQLNESDTERLNKDLAHLTYSSALRPLQDKLWRRASLAPMVERCHEFIIFMLERNRHCWSETRTETWHNLLSAMLRTNDSMHVGHKEGPNKNTMGHCSF